MTRAASRSVRVTGAMRRQGKAARGAWRPGTRQATWTCPHLEDGSLVSCSGLYLATDVGIYAVYPHRRHLPEKNRAFIDSAESFGPEPYWTAPRASARPSRELRRATLLTAMNRPVERRSSSGSTPSTTVGSFAPVPRRCQPDDAARMRDQRAGSYAASFRLRARRSAGSTSMGARRAFERITKSSPGSTGPGRDPRSGHAE